MNEEIRRFLKRLKTVRTKATEEGLTTMGIYQRISKGVYETIEIDGVKFIIEDENKIIK